jgi:hypothetical protein
MKKIKRTLPALAGAAMLFAAGSCEEQELKTYDGVEGAYFYVRDSSNMSYSNYEILKQATAIDFGVVLQDTIEARLRVMFTGKAKTYPRSIQIIVDADSSTAVVGDNYAPLLDHYTVEPGASFLDVPLRFFRHENISTVEKRLELKLVPTSDFVIGIARWVAYAGVLDTIDVTRHTYHITGVVAQPYHWSGSKNSTTGVENGNCGAFSMKKFQLICELFDLTYDDFLRTSVFPTPKKNMIGELLGKYLQKMYDARTPVLEDDGRLMWAKGVTWTSIVGVAWDGVYQ